MLFTGSTRVGKLVMKAARDALTPASVEISSPERASQGMRCSLTIA
jgi:acyl-CoA reductase-like NAD-dependent aldehyde dehydrogenase